MSLLGDFLLFLASGYSVPLQLFRSAETFYTIFLRPSLGKGGVFSQDQLHFISFMQVCWHLMERM